MDFEDASNKERIKRVDSLGSKISNFMVQSKAQDDVSSKMMRQLKRMATTELITMVLIAATFLYLIFWSPYPNKYVLSYFEKEQMFIQKENERLSKKETDLNKQQHYIDSIQKIK